MFGFTKQEQGIVLFLIFALVVGLLVGLYKRQFEPNIETVSQQYIDEFERRTNELASSDPSGSEPSSGVREGLAEQRNSPAEPRLPKRATTEPLTQKAGIASPSPRTNSHKFVVNINTASEEELLRIPRIGPVTAQKIIRFREKNGGFHNIEQLVQIAGIGQATLSRIKPYITIN